MTLLTALSIPCYFVSGMFFFYAASDTPRILTLGEGVAYVAGMFIPSIFFFGIGLLLTGFAYKRKILTEKETHRQQALNQ